MLTSGTFRFKLLPGSSCASWRRRLGRHRRAFARATAFFLKRQQRLGERANRHHNRNQTHRSCHNDPASRPLPKALLNMAPVYTKASVFPAG